MGQADAGHWRAASLFVWEDPMEITRREAIIGAGAAVAAAGTLAGFPAIAQTGSLKVGVFFSETDAQGVDEMVAPYMAQMRAGLELAAAEINAGGGIVGRQVELFYTNDLGSPPSSSAVQAMINDDGAEVIVSGFVQASPRLITVRSPSPVPILAGFWTDGSYCGPVAKQVAPTVRQIVPPIRDYLPEDVLGRPFSVTNWTPSGRNVSLYLYGNVGAAHVGDALVTTPIAGAHAGEFQGVMRWADDMEASIIWVAEPRPYSVNVVNQAVGIGVAEGKTFAYLDFSEIQAAQLVPGASITTCLPFIASDPSPGVQDFVSRAQATGADLVTHVLFTHYNALMSLKAAMETSGDATSAGAIAGFANGVTIDTATGPLTVEPGGYSTMTMYLATASGGQPLQVAQKLDALPSGTTC
jgi:ABC-type branched-subunit amino acid transport system substrate-binding protein